MSALTVYLSPLTAAIEHARRSGEWIVVVAPTDEQKSVELGRVFVSVLSRDASLCGRTAIFPGGGRVTVVGGSQPLHGTGFRVMFVGFDGKLLPADEIAMHAWRTAAIGHVTLGDRPGELRLH
jgi:hypothetical protein